MVAERFLSVAKGKSGDKSRETTRNDRRTFLDVVNSSPRPGQLDRMTRSTSSLGTVSSDNRRAQVRTSRRQGSMTNVDVASRKDKDGDEGSMLGSNQTPSEPPSLRVSKNSEQIVDQIPDRASFMPNLSASTPRRTTAVMPQQDAVMDVEALLRSDEGNRYRKAFAWVEGPTFSGVVLAVLLLNGWALALETDQASWPWWRLVNGFFLLLYIVEYALRALHRGFDMLCGTGSGRLWMLYDLVCVILGILDFLVSCLFAESYMQEPMVLPEETVPFQDGAKAVAARRLLAPGPNLGAILVRGLMFTRLLRIVRILRMHGPLYSYVKLLLGMMNTYVWILSIIFILCFVTAIVLTSLVEHGILAHSDDAEVAAKIADYFSDVPGSLFTLFQLVTAEDWSKIQNTVIVASPGLRGFFIFFIVFMSWTMLSLLTAVASETMISAASSQKEQKMMDQEVQRHTFAAFLCAEFLKADTDGNRVLDKEEFAHLMSQPQMKQCMKENDIHLQETDLLKLWDTFDIDESGELDIDELVAGFSYMQENLAMKHVANVCYSLKHFGIKMETNTDVLQTGVDELTKRQTYVGQSILADLQWQQQRWSLFHSGEIEELTPDVSPDQSISFEEGPSRSSRRKESMTKRALAGIQHLSRTNSKDSRIRTGSSLTVPLRISRSSSSIRSPSSVGSK